MGGHVHAYFGSQSVSRSPFRSQCCLTGMLIGLVALAGAVQPCTAQPAHAVDPLRTPYFGIDRFSTSVTPTSLRARDILDKEGPHVVIPGTGMGLANFNDELDDFSVNRNVVTTADHFVILFSVDKTSTGGAMPDPFLTDNNRPFNVRDQALKKQAHGDIFMSTGTFTRLGPDPLTGDDLPVPHGSPGNNTLVKNQGDTGGVDLDLEKDIPPEVPTDTIDPSDELDGISEKDASSTFSVGVPTNPAIFYTLRNGSPSLTTLPGTPPSGANVYFDINPLVPGTEQLYASAAALGLVGGATGDDIDALVVFDNGDGVYQPNVDQVMFSLTRNSPSLLGGQFSPADIFMRTGTVTSRLATAASLGLAQTDNVDGIEIKVTTGVMQTLLNTAIFRVVPGDFDGNGGLSLIDFVSFRNCFGGPGVSYDTNGMATIPISVGPGNVFSPAVVTIETGDLVRWTWMGGVHNVVSGTPENEDGAFFSGAPTGVSGTVFNVTFGKSLMNLHPHHQGVYPYFSTTNPNMTGFIHVLAPPCAVDDLDYDGDVDCADWQLFRKYFQYFNGVGSFVPLSVPEFITVLLGGPGPAVNACIADVNGDGAADGLDIQPYVDALIN